MTAPPPHRRERLLSCHGGLLRNRQLSYFFPSTCRHHVTAVIGHHDLPKGLEDTLIGMTVRCPGGDSSCSHRPPPQAACPSNTALLPQEGGHRKSYVPPQNGFGDLGNKLQRVPRAGCWVWFRVFGSGSLFCFVWLQACLFMAFGHSACASAS